MKARKGQRFSSDYIWLISNFLNHTRTTTTLRLNKTHICKYSNLWIYIIFQKRKKWYKYSKATHRGPQGASRMVSEKVKLRHDVHGGHVGSEMTRNDRKWPEMIRIFKNRKISKIQRLRIEIHEGLQGQSFEWLLGLKLRHGVHEGHVGSEKAIKYILILELQNWGNSWYDRAGSSFPLSSFLPPIGSI